MSLIHAIDIIVMIFSLILITFVRSFCTEMTRKPRNYLVSCSLSCLLCVNSRHMWKSCLSKYISDYEQQMEQHRGSWSDILHKMLLKFGNGLLSPPTRNLLNASNKLFKDESQVVYCLKIVWLLSKKYCQLWSCTDENNGIQRPVFPIKKENGV